MKWLGWFLAGLALMVAACDPCKGVKCDSPPADVCLDVDTLTEYNSTGTCSKGNCSYQSQETECEYGCAEAACSPFSCQDVVCEDPPADTCQDDDTLLVYESPGTCTAAGCEYASQTVDCEQGCAQGACLGTECSAGPCCGDGQFLGTEVQCQTEPEQEEQGCADSTCGADIVSRAQHRYCNGLSAQCLDDNLKWGEWVLSQECGADALCVITVDEISCQVCGFGCADGACASEFPVDPSDTAPDLDGTGSDSFADSNDFIYTDDDPIQTGVADGTIDAERMAIIRGRVSDRDGLAIAGVIITILDHPEYGQTMTRDDGVFDMAVNGGVALTVEYQEESYLPMQRKVHVPVRDFVWLPDVVMILLDPYLTEIDLTNPAAVQVARGSLVTDEDGSRQATALFFAGTEAMMELPDDSSQQLFTIGVRATEYTVGENGPAAMPGELPPSSAYTYALEYSVDEALAQAAVAVRFNQPVIHYLENFLGFPVGSGVPSGFYDKQMGQWIAADNGRVIEILSEQDGMAKIDTYGNGMPDTGVGFTVSDAERAELATLYEPGQTLWRVPISHFTPWDLNWPFGPPLDAIDPRPNPPAGRDIEEELCEVFGSIIECQNQVLGQRLPITGTPYSLNYRSNRVAGRVEAYTLNIHLTGDSIPASMVAIELEVEVAGAIFQMEFVPAPNLDYSFTWDGLDAYGRRLQGKQRANVRIGYVYPGVYYQVARDLNNSFARVRGGSGGASAVVTNTSARQVTIWSSWVVPIGAWIDPAKILGAWSLDVVHRYDAYAHELHWGGGGQRSSQSIPAVVRTVFDAQGYPDDNVQDLRDLEMDVDGNVYILQTYQSCVRKIDSDGVLSTVAGVCSQSGYDGDGGPADAALLDQPTGFVLSDQGNMFIADSENHCIRKIDAAGIITTFAGVARSYGSFGGDGGLAVDASLSQPIDIDLAPDGSLYIADSGNGRIRRVGPDGLIDTVAGYGGTDCAKPDGTLAIDFGLCNIADVVVGRDGSIFVGDFASVYKIGVDGIITRVAGGGALPYGEVDGHPARDVKLNRISSIALDPEGALYIVGDDCKVRKVGHDGRIMTVAGYEKQAGNECGYNGDELPATMTQLQSTFDIFIDHEGSLFILEALNKSVREVVASLPGFSTGEIAIASTSGAHLFSFDATGRHQSTRDARTGTSLIEFGYTSDNLLSTVTNLAGLVTSIGRDATGNPEFIEGPYGQRTVLGRDANGYLNSIENPAGEVYTFSYADDGLMLSMTDPKGNVHDFQYDSRGNLTRDENPAGGIQTFTHSDTDTGYQVERSTALGRSTTYTVEKSADGTKVLTNTFPGGQINELAEKSDASKAYSFADGTQVSTQEGPDPRWGMSAPVTSQSTVTTPQGRNLSLSTARSTVLSDPDNSLSLTSETITSDINGRVFTSVYESATRKQTFTSPEGRVSQAEFDEHSRLTGLQAGTLDSVRFAYDADGRISSIAEGEGAQSRVHSVTYDSDGQVATISDPLLRTVTFTYDQAGRVLSQTMPDGRVVGMTYDANGNITTITPPGRPAHAFAYDAIDRTEDYIPPDIGAGSNLTHYDYNLDNQLEMITRPDGKTIEPAYNSDGRLSSVTIPRGTVDLSYHASTGQIATVTAPDGGMLALTWDGPLLETSNWTGSVAGNVSRSYDNNLRLDSLTVGAMASTAYTYDNDGLLTQAGDLTLTRDSANGLLAATTLGNITTSNIYSVFGEVLSSMFQFSASSIFNVSYQRDLLGRITEKTETIEATTTVFQYDYDQAGRLHEVRRDGTTISLYDYDDNSNRVAFTDENSDITNATYDAQDRMLTYGDASYTYTPNGELATKTDNAETTTYTYDVLGNLTQVSLPDGTEIAYLIDGNNRRIGKKIDGTLVQGFLYQDQLNPVAELDGTGDIVSLFVYGSRANVPDYMLSKKGDGNTWITYRIVIDYLGSPRMVVDTTTGTTIQQLAYSEFGEVLQDTNSSFQPFGFGGGIYDHDIAMTRFGARDYVQKIGRWTTKDPILFDGFDTNLYGYVLGDPVNAFDLDGNRISICWTLTHASVKITSSQGLGLSGQWGFAPAGGILEGLYGTFFGAVKGRVASENFNMMCFETYADDAMDILVWARIHASKENPPSYIGTLYNCIDWALDMVRGPTELSNWEQQKRFTNMPLGR